MVPLVGNIGTICTNLIANGTIGKEIVANGNICTIGTNLITNGTIGKEIGANWCASPLFYVGTICILSSDTESINF